MGYVRAFIEGRKKMEGDLYVSTLLSDRITD